MMRCQKCNRLLKAATITVGSASYGMRCARNLGLMPIPTQRKKADHRPAKRFDDGQAPLFEVQP